LSEKQGGTQEAILPRLGLGTHLYRQLAMPKMGSSWSAWGEEDKRRIIMYYPQSG
jgi:hypothetical protein